MDNKFMQCVRPSLLVCVFVLASLLAVSCGVYNGSSSAIPLFQQRGEVQVELGVIPYPFIPNAIDPIPIVLPIPYSGTVSFSPTDRLGVSLGADLSRQNAQAMVGVYNPIGDHFVWELFGGFSAGRGSHHDHESLRGFEGYYLMPFIQADCGWRDLTRVMHIDLGFSLRLGGIYGNTELSYGVYAREADEYITHSRHFEVIRPLIEPAIEFRFGWSRLKFNIRTYKFFILNNSYHGSYQNHDIPVHETGFGFGFGVSYRFGGR